MQCDTVTPAEFIRGLESLVKDAGKHDLRAEQVGQGIVVKRPDGSIVDVKYAGSIDSRTVYAYVEYLGIIGGWRYPHRKQPFLCLVESINRGILYHDMNSLPNGRRRGR